MKATAPPTARTSLTAALVVAFLAVAWALFSQPAAGKSPLDRQSLLALLKAGKYENLDRTLGNLQDGYERGEQAESMVENAFAAFASADPGLQARLDAWVARSPQSFAARLARGEYYRHLGRISVRNGSPVSEVDGHPDAANETLSLARRDVEAAIERRPRLGIAYASLISIAMAESAGDQADRWFNLGLEKDPASAALRRAYFLSLRPWRRPDQDPAELMAKLDELVKHLGGAGKDDPGLAALRGFRAFVTAELLRRQRRYDQASRYYRDALAQGRDPLYLRGAGLNALQSANSVYAVGYLSDALALRPQNPTLLDWRAHALWSLGNQEAAFADWRLAVAIDPGNPDILYGYARALREAGQAGQAAEMLTHAVRFARDNPQIRGLLGEILLADLHRPADAIPDLRYAVERDPQAGESLRAYAEALYRTKDCDGAADAITAYQRLCANGTTCPESDLAWARDALRDTRDPDICPVYGILGP